MTTKATKRSWSELQARKVKAMSLSPYDAAPAPKRPLTTGGTQCRS